jgi:hypothetical protein
MRPAEKGKVVSGLACTRDYVSDVLSGQGRVPPWQKRCERSRMTGARRMWRYPVGYFEKLTARCAGKLAAQHDAAKQLKAERAAERVAERAAKRAEWKRLDDVARLVKAARRAREAAESAAAPRISPE